MIRVDSSEQQVDAPHPLAMLSRGASGHATAPPSNVMTSRRFASRYFPRFRTKGWHTSVRQELLRCGISVRSMSAWGHSLQIRCAPKIACGRERAASVARQGRASMLPELANTIQEIAP
jgi:hypothetical protein